MYDNEKFYFEISEESARAAKRANSFRDYVAGSATAEYRQYVDKAIEIAQKQKDFVSPLYHEKIDNTLERYCRKLAENTNSRNRIDASVPSIMISGGGNFPVRRKEKQNQQRDNNIQEWQYVQSLLDKIESIGTAGNARRVYCVESGMTFASSSNGYQSDNGTNSGYMNLLPYDARLGISLVSLYGWREGAALPVGGINADDYYFATQILLWEYQQGLRNNPHNRQNNGSIGMNQYYDVIKGRPAEKAYHWILDQVAAHENVPSFTGGSAGSAPTYRLKYDALSGKYSLTLTDTNNTNADFKIVSGNGVTITRSGNQYTFTNVL